MKIAIVYDCPFPFVMGGGQKRLYEIAKHWHNKGHEITWYSFKYWDGPNKISKDGINYVGLGRGGSIYTSKGKRSVAKTLKFGLFTLLHPEIAKNDVIHAGQWPYFHLFPLYFYSKVMRRTFLVDWWEVWGSYWREYFGKKGFLGRMLEKMCCKLPSRLVAISQLGKEQLMTLGVRAEKIQVIHNGIDIKTITEIPASDTKYDLVYMGRLKDHKNVEHIIKALVMLKSQALYPTCLIIGDGPEQDTLKQLVKNNELDKQVSFTGRIENDNDAYALLKTAKFFVHPSTKEGGGSITLLEANACGLPVIAYKAPYGIDPALIEDGVTGFWVPEISIALLSQTLKKALSFEQYSEMKAQTLEFAKSFDWGNIAEQYTNIYKR